MEMLDSSGTEGGDNGGSATPAAALWNATDGGVNVTAVAFSPYYQHSLYVAVVYILAYFFIFLLCMAGNILVCLIVLENRRMRTVTNLFILNLAVSDLLVGIFCIPTTLVDNLITGWPFSNTVCKMSGFVQGMSVSASVFTLVAIAVERFRCIVYPLQPKPSVVVAKAAIVLIWVLAVIIMCPAAIALTVEKIPFHYRVYNHDFNHTFPLYTCYENFANPLMRKVYTAVLFSHIYLVPLTVISVMYGSIGIKLCSSVVANTEPRIANATVRGGGRRGGHQMISQKKIRVIKMLILVALLFMLSWLPLWTLMMMTDYGGLDNNQIDLLTSYIFPFAHWLAFANSSVNPIIYGYFNENFKRGFQAVCKARTFRGLLRCHQCRRVNRCARRPRSVQRPCDNVNLRDANSHHHHHHMTMGLRNRVHNDNKLTDGAEWNRGAGVACVVVHPARSVSDHGLEMGTNRNSTKGGESCRVSSMAVSLYQAWEN